MAMTLADIRAKYPAYQNVDDQKLADAIYAKHYSTADRREFDARIGLKPYDNVAELAGKVGQNLGPTITGSLQTTAVMGAEGVKDILTGPQMDPGVEQALGADGQPLPIVDNPVSRAARAVVGSIPGAEENIRAGAESVIQDQSRKRAVNDLKTQLNAPDIVEGSPEDLAYQVMMGGADMAAPMLTSIVLRNPSPMAAYGAMRSGADGYKKARDAGLDPAKARLAAGLYAAAEAVTEAVGTGKLLEGGKTLVGAVLKGVASEGITEALTEALQAGVDTGIIGEEITLDEAVKRIGMAGAVGGILGGAFGGVSQAVRGGGAPTAAEVSTDVLGNPAPVVNPDEAASVEDQLRLPAPDTLLALPSPEQFKPADTPRRNPAPADTGIAAAVEQTPTQQDADYQARVATQKTRQAETAALLQTARETVSPLGSFTHTDLPGPVVQRVNTWRAQTGKDIEAPITIEDMARAKVSQTAINNAVAQKRPMAAGTVLKPADVTAIADTKNIVSTDGAFKELALRTTGTRDITRMTQTQLNAMLTTLEAMPAHDSRVTLPIADASPFTDGQYNKALDAIRTQGRFTLSAIKDATGLKTDKDAHAVRDAMVRRGQLTQRGKNDFRLYDVAGQERQTTPADVPQGAFSEHVVKRLPVNRISVKVNGKSVGNFGSATEARTKIRDLRAAETEKGGPQAKIELSQGEEVAYGVMENRYDAQGNLLGQVVVDTSRDEKAARKLAEQRNNPTAPPVFETVEPTGIAAAPEAPKPAAAAKRVPPAALEGRVDEVLAGLSKLAKQRALPMLGVKVTVTDSMTAPDGSRVEGAYMRNLINIAAANIDPNMNNDQVIDRLAQVMDHELIHALKAAGILGPETAGWKSILRYARKATRPGSSETYMEHAKRLYENKGIPGYDTIADIEEEAIAEAFRAWAANRRSVTGQPASVFRQLVEWFKHLFNAIPEDVFVSIETGQMVRDALTPPGADMPRARAAEAMTTAREEIQAAQAARDKNAAVVASRSFLRARDQAREDRLGKSGPKTVLGTTPSKSYVAADAPSREGVDAIVQKYREKSGISTSGLATMLPEDIGYSMRVADAQQRGVHDPKAVDVAKAYRALNTETRAMFDNLGGSGARPTSFTTSKGSTYSVAPDGKTARNKSYHPEHGKDDVGQKKQSARTVYVGSDASVLSAAGLSNIGDKGARVAIKDGKATMLTWNKAGGKWGASPESRGIQVFDEPAVGRYPLELWSNASDVPGYEAYSNMHAGNPIVSMTGGRGSAKPLEVVNWTGDGAPYASAADMMTDIENGRVQLRLSDEMFGPGADNPGHPMNEATGLKATDGAPVTFNDMLRVVHDVYGRAPIGLKGTTGRNDYNAYHEHARLLSPEARRALATETLAQSAWHHYGPHLRRPDGTVPRERDVDYLPPERKEFAEQKAFLLPEDLVSADPGFALADQAAAAVEAAPKFSLAPPTDTPAFKRWFGGSKVVNEDGSPLVVFHGTNASFDTFDIGKLRSSTGHPTSLMGFFFTTEPGVADEFAGRAIDMTTYPATRGFSQGANVMPVFLDIRNPWVLTAKEFRDMVRMGAAISTFDDSVAVKDYEGLRAAAKQFGNDGFLITGDKELSEQFGADEYAADAWVAFEPTQIKSAIANKGTYDATNPDIRYSLAPPTDTPAFKRWFGDSKVVDAAGKPLVVYHGSRPDIMTGETPDIEAFDTSRGDYAKVTGTYFSANPDKASRYAFGGSVYPAYVSLSKPASFADIRALPKELTSAGRQEALIAAGFDGYIGRDFGEVVAFEPTQIKSVNNRGTFDPANADIRYSRFDDELPGGRLYGNPNRSPGGAFSKPDTASPAFTAERDGNKFFGGDMADEQLRMAREGVDGTTMLYLTPDEFLALADPTVNPEQDVYDALHAEGFKFNTLPSIVVEGYAGNVRVTASDGAPSARSLAPTADLIPVTVYSKRKENLGLVTALDGPGGKVPWPALGRAENFLVERGEDPKFSLNAQYGNRVPDDPFNIVDQRVETYVGKKLAGVGRSKKDLPFIGSIFDARVKFQDRMLSVKEMIENLKLMGGKVTDATDVYMNEQLAGSRTVHEVENRERVLYEPIFEALRVASTAKNPVSVKQFEDYLYARHAPERNMHLRARGAKAPNPSGMSDSEASAILDKAAIDGKLQTMEDIAAMIDAVVADTNKTRVDAGLISQAAIDQNPYDYYVPLRGKTEEDLDPNDNADTPTRARSGKGYAVGGREDRAATGRERKAGDILSHTLLQNTESVIRAEKNKVALSFMRLLQDNPDSGFGRILKTAPTRLVMGPNGMIREAGDPSFRENNKGIFSAKWKGKEIIALVEDLRVARAMRADYVQVGGEPSMLDKFVNTTGRINRYLATINTSWNPEFLISNLARDMQTAAILGAQYDIKGMTKKIITRAPEAALGIREVLRDGTATTPMAKAFKELQDAGGTTEFLGLHDLDTHVRRLRRDAAMTGLNPTARQALDRIKTLGKFIDDYNKVAENAFRLGAYTAARDAGVSVEKAAFLAKNLTVNFNKGGENKAVMNSLWLFYNASVAGTFVLLNGLKNKRVQRIVAGVVVAGAVMDLLNRAMSGDDDDNGVKDYDDIPDYVLETNWVFMIPGSKNYLSFPMPYGFNAFQNLGRNLSNAFSGSPVHSPGKSAMSIAMTAINAFNPIGGAESPYNFVAPTFADPIVDLINNKDFAGNPIVPARPTFGLPTPDSQKYWANTGDIPKWTAEHLNRLTGGNEIRKGAVDVSPEVLQYWFDYATGATGKFVARNYGLGQQIAVGDFENIELGSIPFARRVVGSVTNRGNTERYYENATEVATVAAELEAAKETGDEARFNDLVTDKSVELSLINTFDKGEKALAALRKQIRTVKETDSITDTDKRDIVKQLQDQQDEITTTLNKIYFEAKGFKAP